MASKRSRQAAYVSGAPPTMIDSSAVAARAVPPLTGASSMAIPRAATSSASRRATTGSIVLMQTTMCPGAALRMMPRSPAMTSAAWAVVSTMQIVRPAAAAALAGESATVAPRSRRGSTFAASTSWTTREKPPATRLSAIGRPILPSPMNPTAVGISTSSWHHKRERSRQLASEHGPSALCPQSPGRQGGVVGPFQHRHWGKLRASVVRDGDHDKILRSRNWRREQPQWTRAPGNRGRLVNGAVEPVSQSGLWDATTTTVVTRGCA